MKNIIIAFTEKTEKLLPKILCKKYKHCCVLFPIEKNKWILVQIGTDGIRPILLNAKTIEFMRQSGWQLIEIPPVLKSNLCPGILTCVGFAKKSAGITAPFIWTPDGLYKYLRKNKSL